MATLTAIRIEGGLLGPDVLDQLLAGELPGQRPADFGIAGRRGLTEEIAAIFADARALWGVFQHRLERLPENDPATSVTRDAWAIPFFGLLGFELRYNQRAYEVDGQSFAVSHRAGEVDDAPPVHIVGAGQKLGVVATSGRPRLAPHSLVQEYLNRTEQVWGIVTNGATLRLLRDSTFVRRQAYVEFDLRSILEDQRFQDFAALYRLLHRTRLPRGGDNSDCLLEQYYARSVEQGGRVREHLRDGVEECIRRLANGFLSHPENEPLRQRVARGYAGHDPIRPEDLYRQLLKLIYRLLFLLVAEDRGLLSPDPVYREHYGIARLRRTVDQRAAFNDYDDLWQSLRVLWRILTKEELAALLQLAPLNGDLFAPVDLDDGTISNRDLLGALWHLVYYQERAAPPRRVNYAALDVEELGSVYESLLEFHPAVDPDGAGRPAFDLIAGSERKTTGSYYTPPELVAELINSALEPVLADRLAAAPSNGREMALLSIHVCDPACGSGHFLLAAARRMGKELARIRTGEDEPAPERVREAIRDVIGHCIYGVDKNPLAVDLCRVALWLESHVGERPLTFLDRRIRVGDSLVGVFDLKVLGHGLPDEAFKPLEGDDKEISRLLTRQNRDERKGNRDLLSWRPDEALTAFSQASAQIEAISDDTPEAVRRKSAMFRARLNDPELMREKETCDLWTAAFFQELLPDAPVITSATVLDRLQGRSAPPQVATIAMVLEAENRFFHWPVEFPEVFAAGGFDVVLGNPPWEVMQLNEEEFFASHRPDIARLAGATRKRAIAELKTIDPRAYSGYQRAKRSFEAANTFARASGRFGGTAAGKINTYALFAEHAAAMRSDIGRAGVVVPTGILTDLGNSKFFRALIERRRLRSSWGFDNQKKVFPAVHPDTPFTLLTIGAGAESAEFTSYILEVSQLSEPARHYRLSATDIARINPNSRTAPVFRSRADAELTAKIYEHVPILVQEGKGAEGNPWGIQFRQGLFNMTTDSGLFRTAAQLQDEGFVRDRTDWVRAAERYVPLYEAKMIHQFDHRWATHDGMDSRDVSVTEKMDPTFEPASRYWVPEIEVEDRSSPLPKEFLSALKTKNFDLVALLVAQFLFALWLAREGYPDKSSKTWKIFNEWKAFVLRHPGLRNVAPTRIGLAGENAALMEPTNANCVPAAPVDSIVNTERTKTAWYEADAQTIATLTRFARERVWMKEPKDSLGDESAVLAFGAWMRAASCPTWLMGWRDITNATNERTVVATSFPRAGVGNNLPLMLFQPGAAPLRLAALQGCLSSLVCDAIARHKVGGTHLNFFIYEQLPILPPAAYSESDLSFIVPRVLELTYTSHEMAPFARDLGYDGQPFAWNEDRRAQLRAELDAFYARAYGLTRDELRYILDPKEVMGSEHPSESFRVLKESEARRFGEYRTARLVLAAYDAQTETKVAAQ